MAMSFSELHIFIWRAASSSPPFLCLLYTFRRLYGRSSVLSASRANIFTAMCSVASQRRRQDWLCKLSGERLITLFGSPLLLTAVSELTPFWLSKAYRDPATSTLEAEERGSHCLSSALSPVFNQALHPRRWSIGSGSEDDMFSLWRQLDWVLLT